MTRQPLTSLPWPSDISFEQQSVLVPGSERPGQTGVYQSAAWGYIGPHNSDLCRTLDELFEGGLAGGADKPFLGHRPILSKNPLKLADHYEWETWGQVDARRRDVGSALETLFRKNELGGGDLQSVGIWSINRPEWQIIDIALRSYNKVSVSLYDTLGKDCVEYVINHAHLSVVFVTSNHIPTLLNIAPRIPCLKLIVSIDALEPEEKASFTESAASHGIRVQEMSELEAFGKVNRLEPIRPQPETVASICYTSGTTSVPKGALLTHESLTFATHSNLLGLGVPAGGIVLSYLPLAHIYERICEYLIIAIGGRIGFYSGDPARLMEDAQILKPHFFPAVPRVLNRVYQRAMAIGEAGGLKGMIFNLAYSMKRGQYRRHGYATHFLWDFLVFRKVKALLGGEVVLITSASAPINAEVMDFLKVAFCCQVFELLTVFEFTVYGMTENAGQCTRTLTSDRLAAGTVGPPQSVAEVKLVDVPAMAYTSQDKPHPRGEVCMRGPCAFAGYYKDPENTKAALDAEGWVHTGDVGEIDSHGRVKIIDRVKNIMKLAQGEYVALEKIENVYSTVPLVGQIYIHGDSLQAYLIAILVPEPAAFVRAIAEVSKKTIAADDNSALAEACKDQKVSERVLELMTKTAKDNGLKSFEMVRRLHLTMDPFTVEEGTLTPTFKIRRKDAYAKYKVELDGLYALGDPSSTSKRS